MNKLIYPLSFALAAAGFLLPFWPLCAAGILLCIFFRRYIFAVAVALLIDIAFGTPTGLAQYLFFPFTVLALAATAARILALRDFIDKNPVETL